MKIKKVNRYYCDHCNKGGCSSGHMKKHEARCTMNPSRICGMCELLMSSTPETAKMLAIMPTPIKPPHEDDSVTSGKWDAYNDEVDAVLEELERITECPVCILAAYRQSGNYTPYEFKYKERCDAVIADLNNDDERYP